MVIPAYNEERLLGDTLSSVQAASRAFGRRDWSSEIVVCDNNSTDGTARVAAAAGARVVFEPVHQIARARNRGARAATGDWLVFLDADSWPTEDLFEDTAQHMASGRVLAGGCTLRMDRPTRAGRFLTESWNLISRVGRWPAGAFLFVERSAFWEVGGFSESLYAAEEIELTRRLRMLARQQGRLIVILHRHPLVTSARKLYLYRPAEHLRFWVRAILRSRTTLTNRQACHVWYDGRR